jgi:hypothetical protein
MSEYVSAVSYDFAAGCRAASLLLLGLLLWLS